MINQPVGPSKQRDGDTNSEEPSLSVGNQPSPPKPTDIRTDTERTSNHNQGPSDAFSSRFLRDIEISDWITAAATFSIAVMTGFYVHYSHGQLDTMRRTLDEMMRSGATASQQTWRAIDNLNWQARSMADSVRQAQESTRESVNQSRAALDASIRMSRTDQRAWIGVVEVSIPAQLEVGSIMDFAVVVVNSGRTPAYNVRQRSGYALWKLTDGEFDASSEVIKHRTVANGLIQPGGKRNMGPEPPFIVKQDIADQLLSGALWFFYFGDVTYQDAFKATHWTHFCGKLNVANPKKLAFEPYGPYNDAN